ncbi:acyltransferase [Bradyrhizobium sp. 4]|nr:acyltransferase [Bradyrhizobium sp. 39]MCK1752522.1 acyltransferase [Bradyrhizobium sp. 135]UPJ36741.1 acyltransferase [Bradyrhizobium sp. 4]
MVLIGHLQDALRRGRIADLTPLPDPTGLPWHAGVDIFFVISGFVMFLVAADDFGRQGASLEFLRRRIIRVVPLYWTFTLLAVVAALLLTGHVRHDEVSVTHVLASLFFVPWRSPGGELVPPLSVGWTLNFEMLFYAVFTIGLLFRRMIGLTVVVLILLGLMFVRTVAPGQIGVQLDFWGFRITLEFLYGIFVAHLFLAEIRLSNPARLFVMVAAFVALAVGNQAALNAFQDRWFYWGVPAAMIVAATVLGDDLPDRPWSRFLVVCGDGSYALYLSHLFTLRAVGILWAKLNIGITSAYFALAVTASIAVSLVVHRGFEVPMLQLLRRWSAPARTSSTSLSVSPVRPGER